MSALKKGSWEEAAQLTQDRPDRWLILEVLTHQKSSTEVAPFERWAQAEPSALSYSALAMAHTRHAWNARGYRAAKTVSDDGWKQFYAGLQTAEGHIATAIELDEAAPEPWVVALRTGRGLQISKDDLRHRFQLAQQRAPFHPEACKQLLQGLCKKWSGSHEEMFEFAHWIDAQAPADAVARQQLGVAHLEFALKEGFFYGGFDDYLGQPDVGSALTRNATAFLDATPDEAPISHLEALNVFLLTTHPTDAASSQVVQRCASRIDGRVTHDPWDVVGFVGRLGKRYTKALERKIEAAKPFL